MAEESPSSPEEDSCCNVCSETFRSLVSLGCHHRFCEICVTKIEGQENNKNCPMCKRKSSKDEPNNFSKENVDIPEPFEHEPGEDGSPVTEHEKMLRERKKSTNEKEVSRPDTVDLKKDLVDWNKPLVWQVGHLGAMYEAWVHQPVDQPIRLFESEFLEARTKAAWYWVLIMWVPVILYDCWTLLSKESDYSSLVYCIHSLFHWLPPIQNYCLITLHFLLHGQHHKNPNDSSRLVFPPCLAVPVISVLYLILGYLVPKDLDVCLLLGIICGYVISDLVHYYLHHGSPSEGTYLHRIKNFHTKHHLEHPNRGLGIITDLWDVLFNTAIPEYAPTTLQSGRTRRDL